LISTAANETLKTISMKQEYWNWYAFAIVCTAVIAKNLSLGVFQQTEELVFLSEHGQTTAVEIGWPMDVLVTEAYTLNFYWSPQMSKVIVGVVCDLAVGILLTLAGTRVMSRLINRSEWRLNVLSILTLTGLIASLIWEATEWYSYQDGVGALSSALFRCVDAIVLFSIAASWYSVLGFMGCITHASIHFFRR
jgi:hypothetical protein